MDCNKTNVPKMQYFTAPSNEFFCFLSTSGCSIGFRASETNRERDVSVFNVLYIRFETRLAGHYLNNYSLRCKTLFEQYTVDRITDRLVTRYSNSIHYSFRHPTKEQHASVRALIVESLVLEARPKK